MIRYTGCRVLIFFTNTARILKYLLLQLQNLLFQLPHFGLFPVSGCLSCDSVLEFPGGRSGWKVWRRKKKRHEFDTFFPWCWLSSPSLPLTRLGSRYCATNRPCSCHVDIPGYQCPAAARLHAVTSAPADWQAGSKCEGRAFKGFKKRFVAVSACRLAWFSETRGWCNITPQRWG